MFRSYRILRYCVLSTVPREHTCDLMVIGGGSGGIAAAKRAAKHGAKVVLADYVPPTPIGTKWGLGGTCVNVGCIPKKLMHTAALQGDVVRETASYYGWKMPPNESLALDWATLRKNVTNHVRSLNFSTRGALMDHSVKYLNAYATLQTANRILCHSPDTGEHHVVTATNIILAMGGHPTYPNIPGAKEFGITSDDIFRLEKPPGETVIVGAGYIALECAGFLAGFGYPTKILVRSVPLRGFDSDAVERVVRHMTSTKTTEFVTDLPKSLVRDNGKLVLNTEGGKNLVCDTVLFAMGRSPKTLGIGLDTIGVTLSPTSHKVIVDADNRTSVSNVYAIGDIVEGGLELTPVAIRQGELLVDRLYASQSQRMNYEHVATTVFTPLEYGCVGLTEAAARAKYGPEKVEVFHTGIWPLEWTVPHLPNDLCFMKVITLLPQEGGRVVGFHIVCPNAGEITQGVAMAMVAGLTKSHLDQTVGIHPTIAEAFTKLFNKKDVPQAAVPGC